MAKKRTSTKGKSRSKFRASWRGQLRVGLVSFEVQAVNAHIKEQSEVHFHLLHEPDHGHLSLLEQHDKVNQLMSQFIKSITSVPAAAAALN